MIVDVNFSISPSLVDGSNAFREHFGGGEISLELIPSAQELVTTEVSHRIEFGTSAQRGDLRVHRRQAYSNDDNRLPHHDERNEFQNFSAATTLEAPMNC